MSQSSGVSVKGCFQTTADTLRREFAAGHCHTNLGRIGLKSPTAEATSLPFVQARVSLGAALVVALTPGRDDLLPRDCSLTPNAYRSGAFQEWKITLPRGGDGGGELFAIVDLDDGRRVMAHNVTNPDLQRGDRVTVAEIACVHRAVYLLTDFPASVRR